MSTSHNSSQKIPHRTRLQTIALVYPAVHIPSVRHSRPAQLWHLADDGDGAAELLSIKPTTLASRMKSLSIEKPKYPIGTKRQLPAI